MKFGDGSFFIAGKKPLARKPEQIQQTQQIQPLGEQQKALSPVKPKKKPGEFNIIWPPIPIQQAKDYKVITSAADLVNYLKRCEETGLCGFDYETTVTDEYRAMWAIKEREFASEIDRINYEYQEQVDAVDETNEKKRATAFKKLEKERDKELAAVDKAYNKAAENDFLKAPLDPWKSEICTVSLAAAPHEARVIFINNSGANRYTPSGTLHVLDGEKLNTAHIRRAREEVFEILNEHLFKNRNIMKIAVNLSFETKQTTKLGMYIMEPVADPLIMWVRCMQVVAPQKILDVKRPATGKGLKPMTWEYLGVKMGNFEELLKKHGVQFFSEISADHQDALIYSAEDSDYAVQHYLYWREIAKQIPRYDEWLHKIEMPFTRVIGLMEYWGMAWDDDLAEQKKQEAENMREAATAEMVKIAKEQFNYDMETGKTGKTGSVQYFLFDVLKVPVAKTSEKTGNASLDEEALIDMRFMLEHKLRDIKEEKYLTVALPPDWACMDVDANDLSLFGEATLREFEDIEDRIADLERLRKIPSVIRRLSRDERAAVRIKQRPEHEHKETALKFIDLIQTVQTCTTLLSSHIEGRRKYINPISKRIHSGYTQWTETGRTNSQSPNCQNVPAPHNDDLKIRRLYVAPPGKVLFLIDFSGFELRILSWKANDGVMQEIFCNDGDMHRKTAATATGKPESEVTDVERKHVKPVNFGIAYCATEYALQTTFKKDYGIRKTLDECAKLIQAVKVAYPGIPVFQREIALQAREDGYVQTGYGYIRLLSNINSSDRRARGSDERRASNTPVQGFAADVMKRCQNEAYELLASNPEYAKRAALIAQVHDEQIFELDDDPEFVTRFVKDVKALMEKPPLPDFPVPVIAEASIGYRWGDKMSVEKWLEMK